MHGNAYNTLSGMRFTVSRYDVIILLKNLYTQQKDWKEIQKSPSGGIMHNCFCFSPPWFSEFATFFPRACLTFLMGEGEEEPVNLPLL